MTQRKRKQVVEQGFQPSQRNGGARRQMTLLLLGALLALMAFACFRALTPIASAHSLSDLRATTPARALHALPTREDPPADAILQSPPTHVAIWFSEDLNPLTSRIVVVDTTNHEVDLQDSHVSASNTQLMSVSLPLLHAGTYVVVWRTQSADDGHIVSGSYIFRIARPDGSVPPVPAVLPTSHIIGGGEALATGTLDGPTLLQTIMTWLALVGMTFWVGGLIWETWVLPVRGQRDSDLAAAALAAARRFARLAPYALGLVLVADVGIILAESAELAGAWSGLFSPTYLRAIVFGSQFGFFWWMRQLVALVALGVTLLASRRIAASSSATPKRAWETPLDAGAIPDWRREALAAFRNIGRLPRRLVEGVRLRSGEEIIQLLLGAALIVAFVLSGHAAAVPHAEFWYAFGVDLFHVVATTAWLGGLLYITVVLLPASRTLGDWRRARLLALGLPIFGALALTAAILLSATGSLNTTFHLTNINQFLTTTYGRTLAIKIEIFLVMVAISAYHAFFLRPRLAHSLAPARSDVSAAPDATHSNGSGNGAQHTHGNGAAWSAGAQRTLHDNTPATAANFGLARASASILEDVQTVPVMAPSADATNGNRSNGGPATQAIEAAPAISERTRKLTGSIEGWIQREALLGIGVLLCVALLGAFAGSLVSIPQGVPTHSTGAFLQTKTAGSYAVTLKVVPAIFGANTFTVTVTNAQGQPVQGAAVLGQTADTDMDMGVQTFQFKAVGADQPGVYVAQSDLTMAGNWQITIKTLPPNSKQFVLTTYHLVATYQQ